MQWMMRDDGSDYDCRRKRGESNSKPEVNRSR
jgi:hypothetical protein